jgi:hypothetical protein
MKTRPVVPKYLSFLHGGIYLSSDFLLSCKGNEIIMLHRHKTLFFLDKRIHIL